MGRRGSRLSSDLDRVNKILNPEVSIEDQIAAIKKQQHELWNKKFKDNPLKTLFPMLGDGKKNDKAD